MERILTQEEISELLSAVRDGQVEVDPESEEASPEREVSKLELIRLQGQGRWRIANFDIILDAFARNFGISLTNRLQQSVTVKRTSIQTLEFEPFLQQLSGRGANAILRLDPLRYGGVINVHEELAFPLVEILLGGSGEYHLPPPSRKMTAIETNVLKSVFSDACQDLAKTFRSVEELQVSPIKVVNNPRLVTIVPPEALVMVAQFEIIVKKLVGIMSLVIPLASLEPLREKLREEAAFSSNRSSNWQSVLHNELQGMKLNLVGRLATVDLSVRDVLNLQVGDVITLDCDPDQPVEILVEDKPKFIGMTGLLKGRKAIRFSKPISKGAVQ